MEWGRLSLEELFYQSYDASRVEAFIQKIGAEPEGARHKQVNYLGEGYHFQAFALATKPLGITVKIAKKNFLDLGPQHINRWAEALCRLKQIEDVSLIPPMQLARVGQNVCLVMPTGTVLPPEKRRQRQLTLQIEAMAKAMGQKGLALDDYPQLMEIQGAFFVSDWSDLLTA